MDEAEVFTVESILEDFASLPDPRSSINRAHLLEDIIVVSILAVIAGADGPKAIGVWAASQGQWLRNKLHLPGGIPSHDTIGRVLMALKPEAFQKCFQAWVIKAKTHWTVSGTNLRRRIPFWEPQREAK